MLGMLLQGKKSEFKQKGEKMSEPLTCPHCNEKVSYADLREQGAPWTIVLQCPHCNNLIKFLVSWAIGSKDIELVKATNPNRPSIFKQLEKTMSLCQRLASEHNSVLISSNGIPNDELEKYR